MEARTEGFKELKIVRVCGDAFSFSKNGGGHSENSSGAKIHMGCTLWRGRGRFKEGRRSRDNVALTGGMMAWDTQIEPEKDKEKGCYVMWVWVLTKEAPRS